MIVPEATIREVTEYSTKAGQRRWLTEHGWKFEVSRTGRPIVLQAEMERHMLGKPKVRERTLKSMRSAA